MIEEKRGKQFVGAEREEAVLFLSLRTYLVEEEDDRSVLCWHLCLPSLGGR